MPQITQQLVDQLDTFVQLYYAKNAEETAALSAASTARAEADGAFSAIQQLLVPVFQEALTEDAAEEEEETPTPPTPPEPEPYVFPRAWEKWIILEPGQGLENVLIQNLAHVGLSASMSGATWAATDNHLRNVHIDGASHWGSRMHNVAGVSWKDCSIRNVEREHGIYANVSWSEGDSLVIQDTLIENVGGQAVQTVWREKESYDVEKDRQAGGRIFLLEVQAKRTGWNYDHGRNAYAFTFGDLEGADRPADMVGCTLDNTMLDRNRGMLVVTARSYAGFVGCAFRHTRAEQTAVLASGVGELRFVDCHFEATNPSDYDRLFLKDIGRLTIEGCTGNLPVYRDGELLGPISEVSLRE